MYIFFTFVYTELINYFINNFETQDGHLLGADKSLSQNNSHINISILLSYKNVNDIKYYLHRRDDI